jgi:predicted ATP-dependent serine protease
MKNYQDVQMIETPSVTLGDEKLDNLFSAQGGIEWANLIFLTGTSGAGKTTFCKKIQTLITDHISVFYSREMLSSLVTKQTSRMDIGHRNAYISDSLDFPHFNDFMSMVESRDDVKIIILDSIQRIASDFTSTMSMEAAMRHIYVRLMDWKDKNNGIVILIGQVTKDGDFQGANFLKHDADAHIEMVFDKAKGVRTIETTKNRMGKLDKLYYEFVDSSETLKFYSSDEYELKGKEFSFDDAINTMIKSYLNTLDKKSDEYKNFLKEIKKTCDFLYNEYDSGRMTADIYYAEIIRKMHQLISE